MRVTENPAHCAAWAAQRTSLERIAYTTLVALRCGNASWVGYYKHKFKKVATPACSRCGAALDDADHFLLVCPAFADVRAELLGRAPSVELLATDPLKVARYITRTGVLGGGGGAPAAAAEQ